MFFETNDLIVDKLTLLDAEDFHRICNQQFILKWMNDWEMELEEVKNLLSFFISGYDVCSPKEIPYVLAIRTKAECLIGICGFGSKEELGGDIEIAFFIDENYARKGFMSQVVNKAIEFYFSLTNEPYLCALVDENNIPSKRILINNNFTFHNVNDQNGILKPHYRVYVKHSNRSI